MRKVDGQTIKNDVAFVHDSARRACRLLALYDASMYRQVASWLSNYRLPLTARTSVLDSPIVKDFLDKFPVGLSTSMLLGECRAPDATTTGLSARLYSLFLRTNAPRFVADQVLTWFDWDAKLRIDAICRQGVVRQYRFSRMQRSKPIPPQPLQFSLGRLFGAVTLISIAALASANMGSLAGGAVGSGMAWLATMLATCGGAAGLLVGKNALRGMAVGALIGVSFPAAIGVSLLVAILLFR